MRVAELMVYSFRAKPIGVRYGAKLGGGRFSEIRLEDDTPDGGRPFLYDHQSATAMGRRIRVEDVPPRMIWRGPEGSTIPDFEDSHFVNVSQRARDILEQVEPGVHQFLPIDYVNAGGALVEKRFMFVICNRIDSVDRERTTMILWRGISWEPAHEIAAQFPQDVPAGFDTTQVPKLVFSEERSAGRHVWVDKHLEVSRLMSDEMADAIRNADLNGIELRQRESF